MIQRLSLVALAVLGLSTSSAMAAPLTCRAHVALNRIYDVQLDLDTGDTVVSNDAGTRLSGRANQTLSARDGDTIYFLATGFGTGVELDVATGAHGAAALCLGANECYRCR